MCSEFGVVVADGAKEWTAALADAKVQSMDAYRLRCARERLLEKTNGRQVTGW